MLKESKTGDIYKMEMVLRNVFPNMRVAQEEFFGPVAPVIIAEDEMEDMRLANDSQYGLEASRYMDARS